MRSNGSLESDVIRKSVMRRSERGGWKRVNRHLAGRLLYDNAGAGKRTALFQNFPNPFNPETWLPYHLATDARVIFRIYNVQGQLTRQLDLGTQKAGRYLTRETAAYWDGRDQVGETISSGIYFYTLQTGPFQATRRMLILK